MRRAGDSTDATVRLYEDTRETPAETSKIGP